MKVFFDERRVTRIDNRVDYGEERYQVIGMTQQRVLFVVYTERSENTIRIISARKATKSEQKSYARFY
ncbi:BrnT family toxin [Pseudoalteromonas sp. SWXJZ94C]|uniref:BrnT family toxin n=1 Tax=Pseudoalteromonas sp. SWXJZ94C TaxID=2792065 RepID=UPI001E3C4155|nr:BrnT family toxin [Pseudoalteromonas sp. SWXJZ94C]